MQYRFIQHLLVAIALPLATHAEPPIADYADPQPPKVTALSTTVPQISSKPYPKVTFHTAPKPLAKNAVTSDWPHFMGPSRDLKSTETNLLASFTEKGPNKVWELERGTGYASPSIVGNHLYYQHRVGTDVIIECLEATTGKRFWKRTYPSTYEDRYGYSNGPRCTPAIAGNRLIIAGVEGQFFCLDRRDGSILWQRDLKKEFKIPGGFFGFGATPLILKDRIIVNAGGSGSPCVLAFALDTGKLLWASGQQWGASYASPVPATIHGKERIMIFAGGESRPAIGGLLIVDPSDGTICSRFPWRSSKYESVNAANPLILDNAVLISASYGRGSALLETGKTAADKTIPLTTRWTNENVGFHWNTPLHHNGYGYGFSGRNVADLVCFRLKDGAVQWTESIGWTESYDYYGEKRERDLDLNRGSLLYADGRHYVLGEYGHLAIMTLNEKAPEVLAKTWLFPASETWTPPVISKGLLFVCQNAKQFTDSAPRRLICYDLRAAD